MAALVALGLVATACGSDDDSDSGSAATAAPDASTAPEASARARRLNRTRASAAPAGDGDVGVSLILKNTSNPFFVSMAESAQAEADATRRQLTVAAGKEDGDTQSQIEAIEAAVARGDAGILITPSGDAVDPRARRGPRRRSVHDRARHAAQPADRRRHHVRHGQLPRWPTDRQVDRRHSSPARRRRSRMLDLFND